jgi:hypothetical protein
MLPIKIVWDRQPIPLFDHFEPRPHNSTEHPLFHTFQFLLYSIALAFELCSLAGMLQLLARLCIFQGLDLSPQLLIV